MKIEATRLGHYPDEDQRVIVRVGDEATTNEIWEKVKAAMRKRFGHGNVDCWQEVTAHIPKHLRAWELA